MTGALRVLCVEDSPTDAKLLIQEIRRAHPSVEFERVEDLAAMRAALARGGWDAIVCDWSLPGFSAAAALEAMKSEGLDLPFIVASGTIGEEMAADLMRAGAHDWVHKDRLARLVPAIERELAEAKERAARRAAEEALRASEAALRKSEAQLRQAQKMEAVGTLAAGVAHDFNNILTVILNCAGVLEEELGEADPLREWAAEIQKATKRAVAVSRKLLMFSRHDVVAPQVLELNEVLLGMNKMLRRLLGGDVQLVSKAAAGLGRIRADPAHVEQVIINLVVNARDAMPAGGTLSIATEDVTVDDAFAQKHLGIAAGSYVVLAVSDTGIGMDQATQARIFEPFFTTKPVGNGTGLGLSTVFGIVQQCKGGISVESAPGQGTTFKIYLPQVVDTCIPVD